MPPKKPQAWTLKDDTALREAMKSVEDVAQYAKKKTSARDKWIQIAHLVTNDHRERDRGVSRTADACRRRDLVLRERTGNVRRKAKPETPESTASQAELPLEDKRISKTFIVMAHLKAIHEHLGKIIEKLEK
jgi:hypothetical protein